MTPHTRFLELTATAIDFPLSPSERSGLDAHLATCPSCARSAAAIRGDAATLGHLPSVMLPERRGAEILAAAMHPPAVRHPLRLVLVVALLALLALGSLVAGAELLRRLDEEKLVVVPPVPTETPGPVPSASLEAPGGTPDPGYGWEPVPDQEAVRGVQYQDVVWTGRGFVATGSALDGGGVFLDSADGRTWHRQRALDPESYPNRLAVGPLGVVAVGDIAGRPASWVSSDGLSWTAAADAFPASPAGTDTVSVTDVVATDTGWLAVGREDPACNVNCGNEPVRALVWTSSDGLRWTPIGGQASLDGGGMATVTRGGPGYVAAGSAGGHAAIWTSTDGDAWSKVPDGPMFGPDTDPSFPVAVFGVAAQEDVVIAVGMDMSDGGGSVLAWWSADGLSWSEATVERSRHGQVFDVAATPEGFLATGPSGEPSCLGGIWASSAGRAWQCVASDPLLAGFGPYASASSSSVEIAVGLTSAGYDENSPLGVPGAVWWRSATAEAPPAASAEPSPSPVPEPTSTPEVGRPPLDVGAKAGGDVIVTGGIQDDGTFQVLTAVPDTTVVGSIPDIEERIPDPWTLLDSAWATPQLSDTGFLALDLTSGPGGDENAAVGVFDLLAPNADPLVVPSNGGGSRMAGDRLWVAMADYEFAVYDLPSTTATIISLGPDTDVPDPFYLSAAGDAVLIRVGGTDGELRMVDLAGVERVVLPDEALLGPIGVERLFGPGGARLRSGPCNDAASPSTELCVLDASGTGTGYDVPGQLIAAAWDPGERIPVWVSTEGIGIIRDGAARTIVRLGAWQPVRIAGFWSNVVILASGASPRLAFAVTGPDAITTLPMPPDSIVALPGDVLLRVVPGEDVPD